MSTPLIVPIPKAPAREPGEEHLVTTTEAAKIVGVSVFRIRAWIGLKQLPAKLVRRYGGRSYLVDPEAVRKCMAERDEAKKHNGGSKGARAQKQLTAIAEREEIDAHPELTPEALDPIAEACQFPLLSPSDLRELGRRRLLFEVRRSMSLRSEVA